MTTSAAESVPVWTAWLTRVRFALATAAVWAGLHYLAGGHVLPPGLDRPLVLAGAPHGLAAGLLVIGVLWIGAAVACLLGGVGDGRRPLMILGAALALWACEGGTRGGTMDAWLLLCHERPGPPTSAPYWWLLPDYLCYLVAIGGAAVISALLAGQGGRGAALRQTFGGGVSGRVSAAGPLALLVTTLVTGVAVFFLTGPPEGATLRGQVYFAVGLGSIAGVYAARKLVKTSNPIWYWPAPFLVGIVGLVVAALNPALMLSPAYRQLDTIPAWGLARPLPVEMVGVGLLACLWMLRGEAAEPTVTASRA